MKKLPIIQSLWIGDTLSTMEELCISSFLYHGHSFHLYTYNYIKNIPDGTTVLDANEIIPSEMIFKYKDHDSYAGFSNLFRYKLLFEKGEYWVDTDVICLQPFTSHAEYIFASERLHNHKGTQVANCVMKVPSHSKIMEYCYNVALNKDNTQIKWGEIGPKLVESAVKKFNFESYIAAPEEFCSINWWDYNHLIDGSYNISILKDSKAIHLWNEMWRRNNIDKGSSFNKKSIYSWLRKTYLEEYPIKINTTDLVSIIIPCYNQAQYLEESVQSALNQLYSNIEIIIVNDGSTDNTQEIAEELQNKYPNIIRIIMQDNKGLSEARNTGIGEALGEYILPFDADDRLDEKMVSKCMNAITENHVDIVYFDVQCFEEKHHIAYKKPFSENNILYENLPPPSSLYRKKVWEEIGGYKPNMNIGYEDWEFWINVYKHNFKFHYLPEVLFYYRVKKESMVTNAEKNILSYLVK